MSIYLLYMRGLFYEVNKSASKFTGSKFTRGVFYEVYSQDLRTERAAVTGRFQNLIKRCGNVTPPNPKLYVYTLCVFDRKNCKGGTLVNLCLLIWLTCLEQATMRVCGYQEYFLPNYGGEQTEGGARRDEVTCYSSFHFEQQRPKFSRTK